MKNKFPIKVCHYFIDSWYDRNTRLYVTQLKDEEGNQIGDAQFAGTKNQRNRTVEEIIKIAESL